MKKTLFLLLAMVLSSHLLYSYDFEVDGLAYRINSDGESVTLTFKTHTYYSEDNYYALTVVTIPEAVSNDGKSYVVTAIGDKTFEDCDRLASVTFPSSLKTIGPRAFWGCSSLVTINLPASLSNLSPTAFQRCPSLEFLTVDSNNPTYDSRGGCNGVIETSTNTLVLGCNNTVIPTDITAIGAHAFDGSGISSITIPGSVRSFGFEAFANCANLTEVHISDLATWCSIDFVNASANPLHPWYNKLIKLDIPRHNTVWEGEEAYLRNTHLFVGEQEVTDLVIPDGVTEIKPYAFFCCSYVQSVHIPSSVKTVGKDAFLNLGNCRVDISDIAAWCNIDFANPGANPLYDLYYTYFEEEKPCPQYSSSYYTGTAVEVGYSYNKSMYHDGKPLSTLVIPEGVTQIKPYAFVSLVKLASLTIPSTVSEIGESAFRPSPDIWGGGEDILGEIKELVWNAKNCSTRGGMCTEGIKNLIIGDGVESLPDSLAYSSQIAYLSLPASLQRIGNYAFANCIYLTDIYAEPMIPPACQSSSFTKYTTVLHTLGQAVASYFDAPIWERFTNLQGNLVIPTELSLDQTNASVKLQQTLKLNATVTPSDISIPLVWLSSDPNVARVDNYGNVYGFNEGEADIVVTCHTLRAVCHVTVTGDLVVVMLDKHELEMEPNEIATLTPSVIGGTSALVVNSSNVDVAKARVAGNQIQVVAVSPGEAIITVKTASGICQPDSCKIIVKGNNALTGDVNNDGIVDISDVNIVVNAMLGKPFDIPTGNQGGNTAPPHNDVNMVINAMSGKYAQTIYCDVNADGQVDISDVNIVINIMLGKDQPDNPENDTVTTYTVNGVSFKMVKVNGGTFMMGATAGESYLGNGLPVHEVTLSSFCIGQTEVTQELWQAVMGSNPSYFTGDPKRPVENVSWEDCQEFIAQLNQLTGETFGLPTEAQWEYAARGGEKSHHYRYAGSNGIYEVAWYESNSNQMTHTVATKQPNELELYDMSGNVSEWCSDWISGYTSDPQTNPTGPEYPDPDFSSKLYRGGEYAFNELRCRVSHREAFRPTVRTMYLGLRLAQ